MKDDIDYNLDQIENLLEATVDAAEAMANAIAQPYWDKSAELRKDKSINTTGWFKYALHVRREPMTPQKPNERLSVYWKKYKWVSTIAGPKMYSDNVKKKADGTYSMASFKDAGPEELQMIEAINSQMQKVWDTLKFVGNTRKTRSNIYRKYSKED